MKLKKTIAAALASLLLLSACGSTPAEEPDSSETTSAEAVENTQPETKPEEKPDVEETIELYIPCYYNYVVPLLPDNTFAALEDYGASNFKKNADASANCTIPKSGIDKYIADSVSNYNKFVQSQESYPIKELILEDDYKKATFQGDPSDADFYNYAASDALVPYLLSTMVYGPDSTIELSAPNAEDSTKLNTISYPPESFPMNSIIGVNLGDVDVLIASAQTETNYAGEPCLSVEYILVNNSTENKNFETCIMDQAFQNGVELDSSIISLDDDFDTSFKDVQPGYSITVKQSYVLPNTTDPVTVEVEGFLSSSNNKGSKTFTLGE